MRVRTLLAHVLQRHLAPPPLRSSFGASARGAYGHGRLRVLRRTGISSFDRDGRRLHPFSACEVDAISIEFFAIPLLFFFGQACLRDCLRLARDLCLSTDICPDAGCKRRGLRDSQLHVIPSVIPGVHLIFLLPSSTCVGQVFSFGCRVSLSVNRCLAPRRPRNGRLRAVPRCLVNAIDRPRPAPGRQSNLQPHSSQLRVRRCPALGVLVPPRSQQRHHFQLKTPLQLGMADSTDRPRHSGPACCTYLPRKVKKIAPSP